MSGERHLCCGWSALTRSRAVDVIVDAGEPTSQPCWARACDERGGRVRKGQKASDKYRLHPMPGRRLFCRRRGTGVRWRKPVRDHPTAGELRGAETISATALGERELVLHGEAVREREGEAGRLERAVRCSGDEFSSWFLHIDDGRRSTEYTEIRRQAGTNNYQYLSYLSYPLRTALPLGPARRSIPPLCSEPAPEALQAPARGTPPRPLTSLLISSLLRQNLAKHSTHGQ